MKQLIMDRREKKNYREVSYKDISIDWTTILTQEEFKEYKDMIKKKIITLDELELVLISDVIQFYNMELEPNYGCISQIDIYEKDFIKTQCKERNKKHGLGYLQILINSSVITHCGAGYLFDAAKIDFPDEKLDEVIDIEWNKIPKYWK